MNIVRVEWDGSNNTSAKITEDGWENHLLIGSGLSPLLDDSVKIVYTPKELQNEFKPSYNIKERFVFKKCMVCKKENLCAGSTLNNAKLYVIHCTTNSQFYFIRGKYEV